MIFDIRKLYLMMIGTVLPMLAVTMLGRAQEVYTLASKPECPKGMKPDYSVVLTSIPEQLRCIDQNAKPLIPSADKEGRVWFQIAPPLQAPSILEVETANGSIIGRISPTGKTWVSPIVANVCNIPQFRRNLRAALRGSARANRYLTACAKRLGSGYGN